MRNIKYYFFFLLPLLIGLRAESQTSDVGDKERLLAYISPARDSASKAYNLIYHAEKGKWADFNLDSMRAAYQVLALQSRQRQIEFIQQNPGSFAGLEHFEKYLLNSPYYKPDSLSIIYSYFNNEVKTTPLGKSINEALNKKKSLSLGNEMPNFSFKTNTGEKVSLSSFRNQKYVLLCFWDSWCAPCIRSIPTLRKIADSYNNGLQLIHVSIDNEESKWLASLKKHPMSWLQTCDIAPYVTGSKVRSMYNIHFIPQYFLIDKEGNLIYQSVLNSDNDDYTILLDILRKENIN